MAQAKDQGLIRHICCSFHDSNERMMEFVDSGDFESITVQYNLLDRQLEKGIAYAHEKGMGVVVMGPVGGGRLGARGGVFADLIPGVKRVPELALRFVLSNPNVTVALSGMGAMEHVRENVLIAQDPVTLSDVDRAVIDEHLARLRGMADLYCSGCNYCQPCPNNVIIPSIFDLYNCGKVYGLWDASKWCYAEIGKEDWDHGRRADACNDCGLCEEKCPQHLPIRKQLREAHEALSGDVK